MTSVLVLRRGGLGDTLLMLPTLRALRRAMPAAVLHFAGVREFAEVLLAHGAVDAIRSSEDLALWALGGASGRERDDAVRARLRRYSMVVADDPAVAAIADAHTTVRVLDLGLRGAEPFGRQLARRLDLAPVWPDDAWLLPPRRAPVAGPVVLAPGSGGRTKCWPKERWLELAPLLAEVGARLEVVVGPTESERDDPRRWSWAVRVDFIADVTPLALAKRLRTAAAFVGNDSGPTHLAAMLAVPTIALFGPTDPSVWAPVGDHVRVLRGASLADVTARAVAAAFAASFRGGTRRGTSSSAP